MEFSSLSFVCFYFWDSAHVIPVSASQALGLSAGGTLPCRMFFFSKRDFKCTSVQVRMIDKALYILNQWETKLYTWWGRGEIATASRSLQLQFFPCHGCSDFCHRPNTPLSTDFPSHSPKWKLDTLLILFICCTHRNSLLLSICVILTSPSVHSECVLWASCVWTIPLSHISLQFKMSLCI